MSLPLFYEFDRGGSQQMVPSVIGQIKGRGGRDDFDNTVYGESGREEDSFDPLLRVGEKVLRQASQRAASRSS
ncbi:hypothetical protein GCM10007082_07300 [Oceanisphaera arctica]|nr:hypothetical protein GCM10007082_07300 [Oceanisphaera arctica]